jgi:Zn finger protein HypA/HybF involved in hydrogenase expression
MKHLIFVAGLFLLPCLCFGAEGSTIPQQITMSVDAELIEFIKITIILGGSFLVIYALIGGAFFGWDVRKARGSINDAQKEIKERLKEFQEDYVALKDLQEKLEELGAKLQEQTETPRISAAAPVHMPVRDSAHVPSHEDTVSPTSSTAGTRSNIDLIREVIASSNYEWTTIGRIMKITGLSHDEILREVRSASNIIISYGRQTKDNIFKFASTVVRNSSAVSNSRILDFSTYKAYKACQNCGKMFDAKGNKPLCPECASL